MVLVKSSLINGEHPSRPRGNALEAGLQALAPATTKREDHCKVDAIVWSAVNDKSAECGGNDHTQRKLSNKSQDASVAQVLHMCCVGVNNRRKNGVLYGISRTITA